MTTLQYSIKYVYSFGAQDVYLNFLLLARYVPNVATSEEEYMTSV